MQQSRAGAGRPPRISVVVPACNEERYLPATLAAIGAARREAPADVEVVVVDNASTDATPAVAAQTGATVVREPVRSVARARNAGAAAARGEVLVFVDADTLLPESLLARIQRLMADPRCLGGAVDVRHTARRAVVRAYLMLWRFIGTALGMAQGATQFCRRDAFEALGGYDETLWMGEDVDFYWRLRRHARKRQGEVVLVRDLCVVPSPRRFDTWPLWKIFLYTNPVFAMLFRRRRRAWKEWYDQLVR